jgi:hypothetical protein
MTGIIETLTLRYGPTPDSDPLAIRPSAMTVLVGPNNSGKSLLLREIEHYMCGGKPRRESHDIYRTLLGSSSSKRRDWKFPGEYQVLQGCSLRPPDAGLVRDLFGAAIREDLKNKLVLEQDDDPSLGEFLGTISSLSDISAEDATNEVQQVLDPLTLLARANTLYEHFCELVTRHIIDPECFCRVMDIDSTSRLARLLTGQEPLNGSAALVHILKNQSGMYFDLAKQGLDVIGRFQRHLSDPKRFGELLEARVVNIDSYRSVLAPLTVLLDGYSRLQQIEPRSLNSFYERPENYLTALHRDRARLEELRKRVHDTFDFYLAIDILNMSQARFVAAKEHPGEREYSLGPDALAYFQEATDLREKSDGVRSFVGIHAALTSNEYRLILLDEPEAFLHPPLVRRLGFELTKMAAERGASIIAATHSADFLMGCVEAGHGVDIIRLGYDNQIATARTLPASDLMSMMRDPLLRSTGVLSALFHRAAVVCEGDSDGAFYSEINERLRLQAEKESPDGRASTKTSSWARDVVFINAHSKQSVPRLMGALRKSGVPAAAVVDLDLLVDRGVVPELLQQAGVDESVYKPLGEARSQLHEKYKALAEAAVPPSDGDEDAQKERNERVKRKKEGLIKRGGVKNLDSAKDQDALKYFLDSLARYGIFVPSCGELESWLPHVSQGLGKGKNWLPNMFERMGTLGQPDYLEPGDDDVWAFMREIALWIDKSLTKAG